MGERERQIVEGVESVERVERKRALERMRD